MTFRKIAVEFIVSDDHAVSLIEALGDAAEKIWKEIDVVDCDMKILESIKVENVSAIPRLAA